MDSRSELAVARPSPQLIATLRQGKEELRAIRRAMSLPEKIAQVLELQKLQYPLLARRRALPEWMRPWDVEP